MSGPFDYRLIRSRRRTLSVEVKDKGVIVRAPLFLSQNHIEKFLIDKRLWVESKLRQPRPKIQDKKFVEGEEFAVLGKTYRLKLILSPCKDVKISSGNIIVKAADLNPKYIRKLVENFYISVLSREVEAVCAKYKNEFDLHGRKLIVKFYRSKWGSCSAEDCLSFNAKLAMVPREVIEYVIVHELVHLKLKNHTRQFWQVVERYFSGYREARRWLRKNSDNLRF